MNKQQQNNLLAFYHANGNELPFSFWRARKIVNTMLSAAKSRVKDYHLESQSMEFGKRLMEAAMGGVQ